MAVESADPIGFGVWRHIAVAWSGDQHKIYVDGELSASGTKDVVLPDPGASTFNIAMHKNYAYYRGKPLADRDGSNSEVTCRADFP